MSVLNRLDNLLSFLEDVKIDEVPDLSLLDADDCRLQSPGKRGGETFRPHAGSKADTVMKALTELGIRVTARTHRPVETSEEHLEVLGNMPGVTVKNLLFKTKRQKTVHLVIFDASKPNLNMKAFGMHLGVGGGLRMADAELVLDMQKGCVTPLATIFDETNVVQVIADASLRQAKAINVHPATNAATVGVSPKDLESFLEKHSNPMQWIDLNDFFGAKAHETMKKKGGGDKSGGKGGKSKQAKGPPKGGTEQEGITFDKLTQFGDWYKELVTKCELIDYTDISGCYVLRPVSYFMWEQIKSFMDGEIKKIGVSNTYFPLFVSEEALKREAKHFEDFSPEVAWVTHSGDTELDKKLAVRPTSETIMYPMFRRWIRSFRDLPLRINQWCNVVRWEFKNPTPFLRTREFLWQEGHTAHATKEGAMEEVYEILDMYARTYSEICAVPTIKGVKTAKERFPGADETTTVEAYITGSGRGIQGATSHCLGQNFAKMFKITYLDEKNDEQLVTQNSWGFTTRSVGVMIMIHSDNKGLVLPPRVAKEQVVVIPIHYKDTDEEFQAMEETARELCERLNNAGIRTFIDDRDTKNPGFKYNEWQLKGIPVRIELGPKDMKKRQVMCARRDMSDEKGRLSKAAVPWDNLETSISELLADIHKNLYQRAEKSLHENIQPVRTWNEFLEALKKGHLALAPYCNESEWEDKIAELTGEYFSNLPPDSGIEQTGKAKALCIPLQQPPLEDGTKCIVSAKPATCWCLFGRSY